MSIFEMVTSVACVLIVGGSWWWTVTRPAFSEAMQALAKRHSDATERASIEAWADGYEAGRELERPRSSRTDA